VVADFEVVATAAGRVRPAPAEDKGKHMSSKGRAVQGARTHSGSGKSGQKSFPLGRVCGQCGDPLSQYNPGPNCWNHTIEFPWRGPTAKPKP
jgi:hypothetical protein